MQSRKKLWRLLRHSKAQIIPFSTKRDLNQELLLKNGWVVFNGEQIMKIADIRLPGDIILKIFYPAVAVAKLSGVTNEASIKC